MRAWLLHPAAKPIVFGLCLLPMLWLAGEAGLDRLGANPAEALIRATGNWTLRLLCLVLAVTPLRVLSGTAALARFRRMLGLFVFFYALAHLLAYSGFDMGFEPGDIARDIAKRPFILVGFITWVVLLLLAMTSFAWTVRRLGARRWQRLHTLVYGAAGLALLHFLWKRASKNDVAEVYVYAGIIAALMGWRVWRAWRQRRTAQADLASR